MICVIVQYVWVFGRYHENNSVFYLAGSVTPTRYEGMWGYEVLITQFEGRCRVSTTLG